MKIAVIGGGIAGINVLKNLVKEKRLKNSTIYLFDHKKYIAKGKAFQYEDPEMLMNYPANFISLKPGDRQDFIKWFEKNKGKRDENIHMEMGEDTNNQYFSRQIFGEYIYKKMKQYMEDERVEIIPNQVSHIQKSYDGYILTSGEASFHVDVIYIAPGQFGPTDPYNMKDNQHFKIWPYPLYEYDIEENKDYAVIGSGLSSIDVVRYIHEQSSRALTMVSRSGQVQSVRGIMREDLPMNHMNLENIRALKEETGFIPLSELMTLVKAELDELEIDTDKYIHFKRTDAYQSMKFDIANSEEVGLIQSLFYEFVHIGHEIWPYLTRSDKAEFMEKYFDQYHNYLNPMPQTSAELMIELIDNKKLVIEKDIENIEFKYGKFRIHLKDKEIRVHKIVNATGPAKQYEQCAEKNQLIESLLDQELLIAHPDGGFYVEPMTGKVISTNGREDNLYLLGQMAGGVNYMNNGIEELMYEAERAVNALVQGIKDEEVIKNKSKDKLKDKEKQKQKKTEKQKASKKKDNKKDKTKKEKNKKKK